jgi:hypothetical protein
MQNREFYRSEKRKCPAEAAGHDHLKFTTIGTPITKTGFLKIIGG